MDKETLSNYGWIVICVLVLAVMIALATPFGNFIKAGVENTATGLVETSNKGIDVAKLATGTPNNNGGNEPSAPIVRNGVIPEGATYKSPDRSIILTSGDEFPDEIWKGDTYEEGDYKYIYGNPLYSGNSYGWIPRVKDKSKTEYGQIISEIASFKIVGLGGVNYLAGTDYKGTFEDCVNMVTSPNIPDSVLDMDCAFKNCKSLVTAPKLPSSTTTLTATFAGCTSLLVAPIIPANINDIYSTFKDCTSLVNAPVIPEGIPYVAYAFSGCSSLSGKIEVNTNPSLSFPNQGYENFIKDTQITEIVGSCSQETKDVLMATK